MSFATHMKALLALVCGIAVVAEEEPWTAVGEKNVAVVMRLNEIGKSLQGKQITPARINDLGQAMASFYAPTISCSAGDRSSSMSFSYVDVPFAQCGGAFAKLWRNVKIISWELENVAIDPATGGKTILTYQPTDFVGMTDAGVEVPGTEFHRSDGSTQYTFNKQGQIVGMHSEFDSGLMDTLMSKVANYGLKAEQFPATLSWPIVGEKNLATLSAAMKIAKQLKGKQVTPDLMAKLGQDMASFYAPRVTCSGGGKMGSLSFSLTDVPFAECTKASAVLLGSTKILDFDMKSMAIDPSSGGARVLTYQPFDFVGTTAGGMDVPGTELHGVDMSFVYGFNDMGEIASYHMEVDTGIIEDVQSKVASFGRGIVQVDVAHDWANTGIQNVATLMKVNDIAKQTAAGKQLSLPLMTKLFKEWSSFYAPQVSCSAGDREASISFSLSEVPFMECAGEFAKLFGNMKVLGWELENVAIDPASSGKTILTYQPTDFVGVTTSGEDVLGTELHKVDASWQYKFNSEGQIAAYHLEMDSGIIQGVLSKVAAAQQAEGLLGGLPGSTEGIAHSHLALLSAMAGIFVGVLIGLRATKRPSGPQDLLDDYRRAC